MQKSSPGSELLEGLLGVLASAGDGGAEVDGGDGASGHQGRRAGGGAQHRGRAADGSAEERDGLHGGGIASFVLGGGFC